MQAAQFDVVFRRDNNLQVRVEIQVARTELCTGIAEDRLVALGLMHSRLMRSRPDRVALDIAQVAEHPPIVL